MTIFKDQLNKQQTINTKRLTLTDAVVQSTVADLKNNLNPNDIAAFCSSSNQIWFWLFPVPVRFWLFPVPTKFCSSPVLATSSSNQIWLCSPVRFLIFLVNSAKDPCGPMGPKTSQSPPPLDLESWDPRSRDPESRDTRSRDPESPDLRSGDPRSRDPESWDPGP